ncbi:hypothetical protein DFH07DRAFT_544607 [Mycena maculata]|uniref:Uncharacterized protein n=1 Tax=Mycena maculata TaxID=230809 RepID=A0AAD7N994_9AGAR|nr:hypothetical protein DFH07DRAFT_544607 [Mycena maculata]
MVCASLLLTLLSVRLSFIPLSLFSAPLLPLHLAWVCIYVLTAPRHPHAPSPGARGPGQRRRPAREEARVLTTARADCGGAGARSTVVALCETSAGEDCAGGGTMRGGYSFKVCIYFVGVIRIIRWEDFEGNPNPNQCDGYLPLGALGQLHDVPPKFRPSLGFIWHFQLENTLLCMYCFLWNPTGAISWLGEDGNRSP